MNLKSKKYFVFLFLFYMHGIWLSPGRFFSDARNTHKLIGESLSCGHWPAQQKSPPRRIGTPQRRRRHDDDDDDEGDNGDGDDDLYNVYKNARLVHHGPGGRGRRQRRRRRRGWATTAVATMTMTPPQVARRQPCLQQLDCASVCATHACNFYYVGMAHSLACAVVMEHFCFF
jgi:hypothetical protein